ncbi:calcium-binding protein [Sinorhizobium meliloti]|uniref:calcium-binding protein n=1 Tax=Rhizobium meliloti TaxID=382 RepID=UPI003D660588
MVARTLELVEGASEPYSVIVPGGGYAVVNWYITAGSAQLNSDFTATPLSGTNVVVTSTNPLNINFNILDDKIAEGREFFTFHIEVEYFDVNGQSTSFVNDDYTIIILDNDTACFIDLNSDGVEDPVELTFDQIYEKLNSTNLKLKNTGDQLTLAVQKLNSNIEIMDALKDAAKLGIADAIVSFLSLGASRLANVLLDDVPEFIDAISVGTNVYSGIVEEDVVSFISAAATLAEKTVKAAPLIGLVANTYKQFETLETTINDAVQVEQRIRETEVQIRELDTRFTALRQDIDKLASCLTVAAPIQPASVSTSSSFVVDTIGNETFFYAVGLHLVKGTSGNDDLTLLPPTFGGFATEIVAAGAGNDIIRFTPNLFDSGGLKVFSGGAGRDVLELNEDRDKFAVHCTADGVIAITPYTTVTVFISIGGGVGVPVQVPAEGPQILLREVERVNFKDGSFIDRGTAGNDALNGGIGQDMLFGGVGLDRLIGNAGDDVLDGGAGVDTLLGGSGNDIYYVDALGEAAENSAEGIDTVFTNISLTLGAHLENLVLQGTSNLSGAGNSLANRITGNAGMNKLFGGAGDDVLISLAGDDTIFGGGGADRIDGGVGTDTASYEGASLGVTASLMNRSFNTNDAVGDVYYSIENLTGSSHNDILSGNNLSNTLSGGDGNDTLVGGAGADRLIGSVGIDTASYGSAKAAVIAYLSGSSVNTNDAAGDIYSSIENIVGTSYGDRIAGNSGVNWLSGSGGNDVMAGNAGNDSLYGGAGADRLYGGAGADKFIFKTVSESAGTSFDFIFDFLPSEQDRIDLSLIDASTTALGSQAFTFVGTAAFKGVAGELRYERLASDTYIYADVNGDAIADLKLHLDDAVTLTRGYFVL